MKQLHNSSLSRLDEVLVTQVEDRVCNDSCTLPHVPAAGDHDDRNRVLKRQLEH